MASAPGDDALLHGLYVHRILTSSQLARKTGRSAPVVRRRMRKSLIPGGLVAVCDSQSSADQNAYHLSKEGFAVMAAQSGTDPGKAPFSSRPPSGPGSPFFRHTKLTNSTWIEFELACSRPGSPVELVRALPEWEMASDPKKRRSKKPYERFVISERIEDVTDADQHHVVRPDGLFLFAPRDDSQLRVAAYLEADRATVSVSTAIAGKILGYWHVLLRRTFARWGAVAMRVCFVVDSVKTDQRLMSIITALGDFRRRNMERHEQFRTERLKAALPSGRATLEARLPTMDTFVGCFRLCRWQDFIDADILTDPIWLNADGERVPFYRGNRSDSTNED